MNSGNVSWSRERALSVLGLPYDADADMVKKAYHTLCKKFHPDENQDSWALDQYLLVQQAYEYMLNFGVYEAVQKNVKMPFTTSAVYQPHQSKIIGTGTRPESEARFDKIRQATLDKQRFEKTQKEKQRKENEYRKLQEERSRQILEEKRKREIESQVYRIMEVLQMLDAKKKEKNAIKTVFSDPKQPKQDEYADNEVFAKKKAYEAFRKYEERNLEKEQKDPFASFYSSENLE